jgi:hypothetical protein
MRSDIVMVKQPLVRVLSSEQIPENLLALPNSAVGSPFVRTESKFASKKKTKLHGLSPRANYTDRATAACRRSDCQILRIEGGHVVRVTDPYGRILGFLDRSRFYQVAPQLYSRGRVDPVPDPLLSSLSHLGEF